jgi:hypothetical protein
VLGATSKGADVPLPSKTLLAVRVVAPVPPLATGRVPVTFVVRSANVVEVVPVPPLAIGRVPVTFVVRFANVVEVVPVPPLAIGSVPVTRSQIDVSQCATKCKVARASDCTCQGNAVDCARAPYACYRTNRTGRVSIKTPQRLHRHRQ